MTTQARLGELLVAAGVLTESQLRKALDAQLQFEGRLGTNLIELSLATEDQISRALAQQHGVCAFDDDDLQQLDNQAARLLSRRAAEHYAAVPLRWSGEPNRSPLRVAMLDAGNLRAVDELAMVTGCRIVPVATGELRMAMLLEKLYSLPRPKRLFVRIVADEQPEIVPTAQPGAGRHKAPSLDRHHGARPDKHLRVRFLTPPPPPEPEPRERATLEGPVLTEPMLPEAKLARTARSAQASERPPESQRRLLAPPLLLASDETSRLPTRELTPEANPTALEWDFGRTPTLKGLDPETSRVPDATTTVGARHRLQQALEELSSIDDRDLAAQSVLGYLASSFECALILVVKDDVAYGWKGYAPRIPRTVIESLVVPLSTPSVFNEVIERGQPFKGAPLAAGERIHARLWKLLSCAPPNEVLVAPVCVGPRLVNLIYAHANPTRRVRPVAQAHLAQLASATALAYRRAIKRAASA